MDDALFRASIMVLPTIIAITFHEAAHGYIAWRLGDDTAKIRGRVSFNPLRHIDLFGTIILPAILFMSSAPLFGWAKPVPVNFLRLRRPKQDMVWVALAGPGINIGLALLSAWALGWVHLAPRELHVWLSNSLFVSLQVNVMLAVFNMLPLPPLDGGRVLVGILPPFLAIPLARMEQFGMLILLGALVVAPIVAMQIGADFDAVGWLLWPPTKAIMTYMLTLFGVF
ncbi:Peptidase M48 [Azospirillaceae bacterium]